MADGLSVAASIAGLLTVAEAVTRKSYQYVKAAKNAKKEISKLLSETTELFGILHSLHLVACRFEGEDFDRSIQTHHVHSCYVLLDKLDSKLVDSSPSNSKNSKMELFKKLAWPFSSLETKEMVADLERQKSTLKLALSVDTMSALLLALSRQESQGVNIIEIRDDVKHLRNIEEKKKRQELLRSLTTVDTERNQEIGVRLRHPGTGLWFLEDATFKKWLCDNRGKLWLYGIPGAGKTVLASTIIQELQKPKYQDNALAYFYCDYKNPGTWNHLNILGSLIRQLASKHDDCFQDFMEFEKIHKQESSNFAPRVKSTEDAVTLLTHMSRHFDQTMIIVDGLDEIGAIGSGSDRISVTGVLKSLVSDDSSIKTIFLSRREQDLDEMLSDYDEVSIAAQSSDLVLYVGSEIERRIREKRLRIKNQDLKEEIRKRLVEGADGMFRWVSCQMDYLCQLPTDGARRRALEHLPPTLHETYERILARVDAEDDKMVVKRVLIWIMFSREPLPISAILEAVSFNHDDTLIEEDDMYDEDTLLAWCSSLVRRTSDGRGLELAHFTVKEFLLDTSKDPTFKDFNLDQRSGDIELAKCCLTYLCFDSFEASIKGIECGEIFKNRKGVAMSLYQYAARYWDVHAFDHFDDEGVMTGAKKLFNPSRTPQFLLWNQFSSYRYGKMPQNHPDVLSMTPLHWACCLALSSICKWHMETDGFVDKAGGPGTPLQCALRGQGLYSRYDYLDHNIQLGTKWRQPARSEVVQILVDAGANVDGTPENASKHDRPLEIAIRVSDRSLTQILLKAGAKVTKDLLEMMEKEGQRHRAWKGYFRDIRLENLCPESKPLYTELALSSNKGELIHLGDVLEGPTEDFLSEEISSELGPALRKAARLGQIDSLAKLLSRRGLQIDTADELDGSTALHYAAEVGQIEAVKLLLQQGSDIDKADNENVTAVHRAVKQGHTEVFEYLVGHEAAITHVSKTGMTILHTAASGTNATILRILLESIKESDLKATTNDGLTLLMCAARSGSLSVINLLIERFCSLDILLVSDTGRSCLHFAAEAYDEDNIKALLAAGAEVNCKTKNGSTPLHLLLASIDPEAFPEDRDDNRHEAATVRSYYSASFSGSRSSASISSSVYSYDSDFQPRPIKTARILRCFRILVSAGADFLVLRDDGLSPVHMLCHMAVPVCDKMLKEVIETAKGRDNLSRTLNHQSKLGSTPLHLLLSNSSDPATARLMVKSILQNPVANVNCQDDLKRSPLICLTARPQYVLGRPPMLDIFIQFGTEILSNLIEHGADIDATDINGRSPLHYLILSQLTEGTSRCIYTLLDKSARVDRRDCQGQSICDVIFSKWLINGPHQRVLDLKSIALRIVQKVPMDHLENIQASSRTTLSIALRSNNEAIVHTLLDRGLDPNLRNTDQDKFSTLEEACIFGCSRELARRLIASSTDISQLHSKGLGPLHFASRNMKHILIEELLLHNLDINTRTSGKHTALHLAAGMGHTSTVELLLAKGADVEARDELGWLAVHHLASGITQRSRNICEPLLKHLPTGWNDPVSAVSPISGLFETITALHLAASDNPELLEFFLDHGLVTDVNLKVGASSFSPLHYAAFNFNLLAMECLLLRGADIYAESARGETALFIAANNSTMSANSSKNAKKAVTFLLEHGSDVEKRSTSGLTAEMAALSRGRKDIAKIIREKMSNLGNQDNESDGAVDAQLSSRLSQMLENSIVLKNIELSTQLISSGTINQRLSCGCTPLIRSLVTEQLDLAKILLRKGADVDCECCDNHNVAFDHFKPAHFAAYDGEHELLQTILSRNPQLSGTGIEPIHLAAAFGHTKCLKILLEYEKSRPDSKRMLQVLAVTNTGNYNTILPLDLPDCSALHLASAKGHLEAVAYLLEEGADIEITDGALGTPLVLAVEQGKLEVARLLLAKGANVNTFTKWGLTPFHIASENGFAELLDLLNEFKCDVTAQTIWGQNALHMAHRTVIPKLLEWGLDLETVDNEGFNALWRLIADSDEGGVVALQHQPDNFNPFHHRYYGNLLTACCANDRFLTAKMLLPRVPAELLVDYVNWPSDRGTPLYLAAYVGNTELVELLLDHNAKPNILGGDVGPALHVACSTGRVGVASLLLKRGAWLKFYYDDGRWVSAFERATHHPRVLEVLKAHRLMLRKGRREWQMSQQLICLHERQKLWEFEA